MASNGLNLHCSSFSISRSRGHYGFHCLNPFMTNGNMLDLISSPSNKLCLSFKVDGRARAVQISGEGNFLSYSSNKAVSGLGNDDKQANQPNATEIQPDAVALATLSAEIIPTSMGFYSDDDEFDLDCPTEGFSSIPEAIEDICQGKFVIVVEMRTEKMKGI